MSRSLNLNEIANRSDFEGSFNFKRPEDDAEKRLRLRKDFITFLIKDVGILVVAVLVVLGIGIYCIIILERESSSVEDRLRAWSLLAAILGGVVGTVFGRATATH